VKGGGLELFFRDEPMTLARKPNEGFIFISGRGDPDAANDWRVSLGVRGLALAIRRG